MPVLKLSKSAVERRSEVQAGVALWYFEAGQRRSAALMLLGYVSLISLCLAYVMFLMVIIVLHLTFHQRKS